jgi:rRNA-processing protein FCF1
MKSIFIDTNIFLHFRNFIEIDWLNVCQSEACKIVIAPIVVDELDKYKSANDDRGKRARGALHKIEEMVETSNFDIRRNVSLVVLEKNPTKGTFTTYDLDSAIQDNHLLASIIEYKIRHTDEDVFLCTDDIGPRLRSKILDIKILKLPDTYFLPGKENELEKEIKTLNKEIALLKSRVPKPLLVFTNQKDFIKIIIPEKSLHKEDFCNQQLTKLKEELPYLKTPDKDEKYLNPLALLSSLSSLRFIPEEKITEYNSRLDDYYKKYYKYLLLLYDYEVKQNLSIKLNLAVTNTGNSPCEDVDVYCHFPDGFELIESNEFEDPPKKPAPPSTPKSPWEEMSSPMINLPPIFSGISPHVSNIPSLHQNKPIIKKTNSYDVRFTRKYVKHLIVYPLEELLIIYQNHSDIKNFSIDYSIIAGNVPEPVDGKLNIIFEKK